MKKLICLALSLLILLSAVPASLAEGGLPLKEKLDAAFESGAPGLTETASARVKAQASDFEFSEEAKAFLKEQGGIDDIDAALAEALRETEFVLLSKSPAGNSGLVAAGKTAVALYNGKYHYVYPSAKGAADEYANLAQYYAAFSERVTRLLGEEGVVYSPDGRYAFICNKQITLMQVNLFIDPVLLDLSTGEMTLTATYPNQIMKSDNAGAVTSAVFSSDGRYFYYVLYGKFGGNRIRLYRYHLDSGETEMCFESEENLYYPHIAELEDGSILLLNDTFRSNEAERLAVASYSNGAWTLKEEQLKLEYPLFYVSRLMYSPNAGLVCLPGSSTVSDGAALAFQLIRPGTVFEGMDTFWCIRKDTDEIAALTPDEYRESIVADRRNPKEGTAMLSLLYPYQAILNAVLSPDGHYLLLHTVSNTTEGRSRNLFLVRLEDMAVRKVSGLDAERIQTGQPGRNYPMNIEWNTEELIIGTDEGIRTFVFTAGGGQ